MTGTSTGAPWTDRARRLSDLLVERGDVRDPRWRDALAAVPRHALIPTIYQQSPTGAWKVLDGASEAGMDLIYSPQTTVTQLVEHGGRPTAVSSSTKPDLMVRMLELLDIADGHRVLEIGTGTGYNAALIAHRLGGSRVFSVDVDPVLVDGARDRLAAIGSHPTLVAADGAGGLPEHAPYDRIIATCSVPAIPWVWAEQLSDGGQILVDLKLAVSAGNLVHLHRTAPDRLDGRFTRRWGAFMALRHRPGPDTRATRLPVATGGVTRTTWAPAQPWDSHREVWFLAQHSLPVDVSFGMLLDPDTRRPTASTLTAPDGSHAVVRLAEHDGGRVVVESGPTSLWQAVENTHAMWIELGEPTWPRLGVTVTPTRQWVWLDDPDGPHTWPLRS